MSQTLVSFSLSIPHTGSRASFLETSVGPATLSLIEHLRRQSHTHEIDETWRTCTQVLEGALQVAVREGLDDDGCEVLYGRAGLLYALLLLRSELADNKQSSPVHEVVDQLSSDGNIQILVDDIVERGRFGAKEYADELDQDEKEDAPALMWIWHGRRYLGGAHGVAGILQMLVSAPPQMVTPYWSDILGAVQWLLEIQDPLGNWPTQAGRHMTRFKGGAAVNQATKRVSIEDDSDDPLVQWCHGAPGVLILLSTLLWRSAKSDTLPVGREVRNSIVVALKRGGELVYSRGLLRKGVGLCHGVAGSVFALLAIADVLDKGSPDEAYWLAGATDLAQLAIAYREYEAKGEMKEPDRPYSLYEGVAGMCCAWAEVLARLQRSESGERSRRRHGMPGYDDLLLA